MLNIVANRNKLTYYNRFFVVSFFILRSVYPQTDIQFYH